MPLLLIFVLTPIVEMYLLIKVGGYFGVWPTIGLVMLTAVIGVALLKRQGVETLTRGMRRMDHGQLPAGEMAEGLLLAIAGALLLTPGFVTDAFGFTLLTPPARRAIAERMLRNVQVVQTGPAGAAPFQSAQGGPTRSGPDAGPGPRRPGQAPPGGTVIEGEFERRP